MSPGRAAGLAAALALSLSCGASSRTPPPPPSRLPAEGDALILQQVLDGTLAAAEGLAQVSRSHGWPIATSQGLLFAVLDGGLGPYSLQSPSAAFPAVTLKSEAGVGWALATLPASDGVDYRFATRFGDPFPDPNSRRFRYSGTGEVSLVAASAPHLERWPGIGDAAIAPRTLRVWVPALAPTHFLYAHDGQNLFNNAATGWGAWRLDLAAGPATLVVGIDNTPARFDEYTPVQDDFGSGLTGGRGAAYVDFIEATVRPFIEARYGTPRRSGVIGSSLGGLIAVFHALRHPGRLDFVASLSGTMGWGSIGAAVHNLTAIEQAGALTSCLATSVYLDSGGGPGSGCLDSDADGIQDDGSGDADNYCENVQLRDALAAAGCGTALAYLWAPNQPHNESAWRARAPAILDQFEALP